jgi:hypothetical protein
LAACVFITFDTIADPVMTDALAAKGITIQHAYGRTGCELYQGDTHDSPDAVDDWFGELPWQDETATLVVYGRDVMVTTVVIDGELVSTTRTDADSTTVDDWLEDAA